MSGFEKLCALISPGDDVIKGSGEMEPRLPCHDKFLSRTKWLVDTYLLKPVPLFPKPMKGRNPKNSGAFLDDSARPKL